MIIINDKRGGLTDIFLFIIISFAVVLISGVFIYISYKTNIEVKDKIGDMLIKDKNDNIIVNTTEIIDNSIGAIDRSYQALYWISILLIIGMAISIFIGSYLVTTKPVFFIPYFFILIIAIVVSVGITNSYEMAIEKEPTNDIFANFVGANFILKYLPIWVTIIGFVGAVIMFARVGSKENMIYGGY